MSAPVDRVPGPDHRAPTVSPKATYAALFSLLAGIGLALITALATPEGVSILGGLGDTASFFILAALPPIAAFLGAYVKRDPLRDAGLAAQQGR